MFKLFDDKVGDPLPALVVHDGDHQATPQQIPWKTKYYISKKEKNIKMTENIFFGNSQLLQEKVTDND